MQEPNNNTNISKNQKVENMVDTSQDVAKTTQEVKKNVVKKRVRRTRKKTLKKAKIVFVSNKRKTAVARARVKKGSGRITINSVDINILEPKELRNLILEPVNISSIAREIAKRVDIKINVKGGGISGQAQAARGAIAKGIAAYAESDTIRKEYLRYDRSLLVSDPRRVEPKKFRGPKARARSQTSYR